MCGKRSLPFGGGRLYGDTFPQPVIVGMARKSKIRGSPSLQVYRLSLGRKRKLYIYAKRSSVSFLIQFIHFHLILSRLDTEIVSDMDN